jgi:hypothetical protein
VSLRSRLALAATIAAVAACGAEPRPTPEVMPEVAAAYGIAFNTNDVPRMLTLFARPENADDEGVQRHLDWLRDKLGQCGAPVFMWSQGKRTARFSYPCELGALEVSFMLDEFGKIAKIRSSAAGVPPEPELVAAAEAVLASLPWQWDDNDRPFRHNLNLYDATSLGKCTMLRPWTVTSRAAMFHVRCEKGDDAVLRVVLNDNGTLESVTLGDPANLYKGPPVTALPEGSSQ